jgi:hypothetical protein
MIAGLAAGSLATRQKQSAHLCTSNILTNRAGERSDATSLSLSAWIQGIVGMQARLRLNLKSNFGV